MSKEILLGPDRPLIGYQDERREIHLGRNVELFIPLERPTLQLSCEDCDEHLVVFYELSTPTKVECPSCGHENSLMRCIKCKSEWQTGDQGFITLDVPDGSRVHDSFLEGPAYVCSAKCLVEAFQGDIFDAKEEAREVNPVEVSLVKQYLSEYLGQLEVLTAANNVVFERYQQLGKAVLQQIPAEGAVMPDDVKRWVYDIGSLIFDYLRVTHGLESDSEDWHKLYQADDELELKLKYGTARW